MNLRAKWNDSEKRSFNGSWGKQPFGEKKSDNFSSRKNLDKGQVNVVHQQVLCALAEVLVEDVLLPPDVLDMLGVAQVLRMLEQFCYISNSRYRPSDANLEKSCKKRINCIRMGGAWEQLPAPGNRSNGMQYRKDLATTRKKGRNGRRERVTAKKAGVVKVDTAERCIIICNISIYVILEMSHR
ncbi:hypothetical protein TNCV_2268411, partial [Trichonephila clavipes]